jgi:hypothetical protein
MKTTAVVGRCPVYHPPVGGEDGALCAGFGIVAQLLKQLKQSRYDVILKLIYNRKTTEIETEE